MLFRARANFYCWLCARSVTPVTPVVIIYLLRTYCRLLSQQQINLATTVCRFRSKSKPKTGIINTTTAAAAAVARRHYYCYAIPGNCDSRKHCLSVPQQRRQRKSYMIHSCFTLKPESSVLVCVRVVPKKVAIDVHHMFHHDSKAPTTRASRLGWTSAGLPHVQGVHRNLRTSPVDPRSPLQKLTHTINLLFHTY